MLSMIATLSTLFSFCGDRIIVEGAGWGWVKFNKLLVMNPWRRDEKRDWNSLLFSAAQRDSTRLGAAANFHRISILLVFLFRRLRWCWKQRKLRRKTFSSWCARLGPSMIAPRDRHHSSWLSVLRVMTFRTMFIVLAFFIKRPRVFVLFSLRSTRPRISMKLTNCSCFSFHRTFFDEHRTVWLMRTRLHRTEPTTTSTTFVKRQPRRLSIRCLEHRLNRRRFTAMETDRQQVVIWVNSIHCWRTWATHAMAAGSRKNVSLTTFRFAVYFCSLFWLIFLRSHKINIL